MSGLFEVNMFAVVFTAATVFEAATAQGAPIQLTQRALDLHRSCLLIDGHNDLPWTLRVAGDLGLARYDLRQPQNQFHTDIPRLQRGGMGAQFWSAYVPADSTSAYQTTLEQINLVERMVAKYSDVFALATSTGQIRDARQQGKIASLIGVEGGHSMENSLEKLRELYRRGARYMTLTHSKNLSWADSATDLEVHGGLTDFGKEVVREMNRLGMMVDISHVSAKTMRDAIAVSTAPVIASHSSAFSVTEHPRNVPDDILQLVTRNGGVIMANFWPRYIAHGAAPRSDVDTLLDHLDHMVAVAGINHVGLGSDFDGVPDLPDQLENVSKFPYITQGLLNRGYNDEDICKILGGNLMTAFAAVEAVARP